MGTVKPKSKQGNTTNLNISFFLWKALRPDKVSYRAQKVFVCVCVCVCVVCVYVFVCVHGNC